MAKITVALPVPVPISKIVTSSGRLVLCWSVDKTRLYNAPLKI